MENLVVIPRGSSLLDLVPQGERSLLELPRERARVVGIGTVEKWDPADLAQKTAIELDIIAGGRNAQEAAAIALAELERIGIVPKEIRVSRNLLVNTGLTDIGNGLTSAGLATPYTNANANIGVGDSSTAAAVSQTDLQAASNKLRKAMDATFPTVANGVYTFRSTFGTSDANFAWAEWAVFNASATGRMLNRAVSALGTKTSAQSWQLTVTITIA